MMGARAVSRFQLRGGGTFQIFSKNRFMFKTLFCPTLTKIYSKTVVIYTMT